MPEHTERRVLSYSAEQLFDLVAAVDRYPEFIPWCREARILRREGAAFDAEMVIGFKAIRQSFGSRVETERPRRIDVAPTRGPFRRMVNRWRFTDLPGGRCRVDFHVDFEFRSRLLRRLIGALFHEAARRMVAAFEARARAIYGPSLRGAPQPAPVEAPAAILPPGDTSPWGRGGPRDMPRTRGRKNTPVARPTGSGS